MFVRWFQKPRCRKVDWAYDPAGGFQAIINSDYHPWLAAKSLTLVQDWLGFSSLVYRKHLTVNYDTIINTCLRKILTTDDRGVLLYSHHKLYYVNSHRLNSWFCAQGMVLHISHHFIFPSREGHHFEEDKQASHHRSLIIRLCSNHIMPASQSPSRFQSLLFVDLTRENKYKCAVTLRMTPLSNDNNMIKQNSLRNMAPYYGRCSFPIYISTFMGLPR